MERALDPLPSPRSIRLLQVFVVDIQDGQLLGFILQGFELYEAPEYHALSYTWGKAVCGNGDGSQGSLQSTENTMERGPCYLTQNLMDALLQLYRSGYSDRWPWVDAICIDQENIEEKTNQVCLMGEIYSRASGVVVWLGADMTDVADFDWLHRQFLEALLLYIREHGMDQLRQQDPYNLQFLENPDLQPPCGSWRGVWEKYFKFLRRRRWFTRAWIVQEVALAKCISVVCGPWSVAWELLEILGALILNLGWQTVVAPPEGVDSGRAIGDEIIRLWNIRRRTQALSENQANADLGPTYIFPAVELKNIMSKQGEERWYSYLQRLLFDTRPYSATDPRDKIFANLGIAGKALPTDMSMPIHPDYSPISTAQSIYTSVARLLLTKLDRLSNLSYVADKASRRLSDLPSWVPDWTCSSNPAPLVDLREEEYAFDCSPVERFPYSHCYLEDSVLEVQGALFDRIVEVCTPMEDLLKGKDMGQVLELCSHLEPIYPPTGEDRTQVLWRTIIADSHIYKPAEYSMSAGFKYWITARLTYWLTPRVIPVYETAEGLRTKFNEDKIRAQLTQLGSFHRPITPANSCLPTVDDVLEKCRLIDHFTLLRCLSQYGVSVPGDPVPTPEEQRSRIEGQCAVFHQALGVTAPFRRLFRTEKGYLGLGPASTDVGDDVWMLQAARVPFVLRRRGDGKFELMGEAYLHGFMQGEMVEDVSGRIETVRIV